MLIKVSAGADTTILERILAVIISLRKREKSHLPAKNVIIKNIALARVVGIRANFYMRSNLPQWFSKVIHAYKS